VLRTDAVSRRDHLAEEWLSLLKELRRRLQAGLSEELVTMLTSVTPHQLEAMQMLACYSGVAPGPTMHEIARSQVCATSTATALVDRLVQQGLAERVPKPGDRRVVYIAATDAGRRLLHRFLEAKRQIAREALLSLDDNELETLIALLRKVARAGVTEAEVAHG